MMFTLYSRTGDGQLQERPWVNHKLSAIISRQALQIASSCKIQTTCSGQIFAMFPHQILHKINTIAKGFWPFNSVKQYEVPTMTHVQI